MMNAEVVFTTTRYGRPPPLPPLALPVFPNRCQRPGSEGLQSSRAAGLGETSDSPQRGSLGWHLAPVFLNRVQHPASARLIRIADSHEIWCRVWGNQGMMHAVVFFTTTPGWQIPLPPPPLPCPPLLMLPKPLTVSRFGASHPHCLTVTSCSVGGRNNG